MSDQRAASDGHSSGKDTTIAKAAGFLVFSGIAMSILKALNPCNRQNTKKTEADCPIMPTQTILEAHSRPSQESVVKKPINREAENMPQSSSRTIEIEKGDTLWGLSKEYGVSIDAIKEANGLTGNTIYAGKKLVIP